jgi:hypothetical protein
MNPRSPSFLAEARCLRGQCRLEQVPTRFLNGFATYRLAVDRQDAVVVLGLPFPYCSTV